MSGVFAWRALRAVPAAPLAFGLMSPLGSCSFLVGDQTGIYCSNPLNWSLFPIGLEREAAPDSPPTSESTDLLADFAYLSLFDNSTCFGFTLSLYTPHEREYTWLSDHVSVEHVTEVFDELHLVPFPDARGERPIVNSFLLTSVATSPVTERCGCVSLAELPLGRYLLDELAIDSERNYGAGDLGFDSIWVSVLSQHEIEVTITDDAGSATQAYALSQPTGTYLGWTSTE